MRSTAPIAFSATLFVATLAPAPAANAGMWPPPAPIVNDACGVKQDRFFLAGDSEGYNVGWFRGTTMPTGPSDAYLPSGWVSTLGASSITVTPYNFDDTSQRGQSYTLSFNNDSDASCVEALDTVAAHVGACNEATGGTVIDLVYTNTDDATDWSRVAPQVTMTRRDGLGTQFLFEETGRLSVADGSSLRLIDGDQLPNVYPRPFFVPGTYKVRLNSPDGTSTLLPNRVAVPACGDRFLPWGDAQVGKPFAKVGDCRRGRVKVTFNNRRAIAPVNYQLTFRKGGKWIDRAYRVAPNSVKRVVVKRQKSRGWVGASFDLVSIPGRADQGRRLVC